MNRSAKICAVAFFAILCSSRSQTVLGAEIRELSVQQFVAGESEWNDWTGQTLRLKGRYSSFTRTAMRFSNCDLHFKLSPGIQRPIGRSKHVEVTGQLQRDNNRLTFLVETLRGLPSDIDQYQLQQRTLPADDPQAWYQLGETMHRQAQFYDDQLLRKLSEDVLLAGLNLEKSQHKTPSAEILQQLAVKAAQFKLPERIGRQFLHEAFQNSWKATQTAALAKTKPDFATLRSQLEKQLPGSTIPLTSLNGVVFDRYRKQPLATYNTATDHARRQLSRLFYLQVARAEFQSKMLPSGSNGEAVAAAYAKIAPDDPATAEQFRQQAMLFRTQNIAQARRSEVITLAQQYRDQDQPQMAQTALQTWLSARKKLLASAGPADYLQTALDYDGWLNDDQQAQEILLAGIEKYPANSALQSQLQRNGFTNTERGWVKASELKPGPDAQMQQAIQAGRIIAGMSPEQVISALGAPKTMTRIASAQKTLLVWNYPEADLAIRFQQRRINDDFQVVVVSPLKSNR